MPKATKRQTKQMQDTELQAILNTILQDHIGDADERNEAVARGMSICEELGLLEDAPESAQAAS